MSKAKVGKFLTYATLVLVLLIELYPLMVIVFTAFTPLEDIGKYVLIPPHFSLRNIKTVLFETQFFRYMLNTIFVAVIITVVGTFINVLAAYAFARMNFPLRNILFMVLLATMVIPGEVQIIPQYLLMSQLGWIDSYKAIIMPALAGCFGIFFMRQFFLDLPHELEESAFMDGCGWFRTFFSIMMPLVRAQMLTIALLSFNGVWDSFLWPMTIINSSEKHLIQVAISTLNTEFFVDVGAQYANVLLCSLPLIILFLLLQKQYIAGVTAGSIKG